MTTHEKLTDAQKYRMLKERQRLRQSAFRKRKQDKGLQQVVIYVPAAEYAAAKEGGLRPLQVIYGLPGTSASAGIVSPEGEFTPASTIKKLVTARAAWGKDSGGDGRENGAN